MKRPPRSQKWIVLWSAIAVVLLWKWANMTGHWADSSLSGAVLPQEGLVNFLDRNRADASDQLTQPPLNQSFETGEYLFALTAVDEWQTPDAIGQLYQGEHLLWEKPLPQQYGPRFVIVGSQGQVLLVDESINIASPYALMLMDTLGEPISTYTFDDIQQVLSVSAAELTEQATSGWWVASPPELSISESISEQAQADDNVDDKVLEEHALISAGGKTLVVNLLTGNLSVQ